MMYKGYLVLYLEYSECLIKAYNGVDNGENYVFFFFKVLQIEFSF